MLSNRKERMKRSGLPEAHAFVHGAFWHIIQRADSSEIKMEVFIYVRLLYMLVIDIHLSISLELPSVSTFLCDFIQDHC